MLWNAQCSFLCLNVNKTEKPHTHIFSKPERSGLSEWPPSSCLLSVCGFGFGISRCAVSDVRACACSASVCVCVGVLWVCCGWLLRMYKSRNWEVCVLKAHRNATKSPLPITSKLTEHVLAPPRCSKRNGTKCRVIEEY